MKVAISGFAVWILLVMVWIIPVEGETLSIPGTGACETILQKLAEAFNEKNPGHEVIIPPSVGTSGGIRAVKNNEAVLARTARPLKEDDAESGLKSMVFAKDAVVFAVGEKVTVTNLSLTQLTDIFAGDINNWEQVGDLNAPVRVLVRDPSESSSEVIRTNLKPFQNLKPAEEAKLVNRDVEMIALLDKYKTSIGYATRSGISAAKTAVKPIGIDNVDPSPENIVSGKYHLVVGYHLIYRAEPVDGLSGQFFNFLFSDSGRSILEKNGLIPVSRR